VSSYAGVRQELVQRQRRFGRRGNIVVVGRDIGTVVMPDAPLKLYITASAEERAQRRWQERQTQGHRAGYESILADVIRRDKIDSSREHAPLRPADDAILIDTTGRPPEAIVGEILAFIKERLSVSSK
jgi:cytidylate kinase